MTCNWRWQNLALTGKSVKSRAEIETNGMPYEIPFWRGGKQQLGNMKLMCVNRGNNSRLVSWKFSKEIAILFQVYLSLLQVRDFVF